MCPLCPSVMGAVSAEPALQTLLYADDFSDGVIAPNIDTYRFYTQSPADTLTETGGKLVFERQKFIWNTDKEYGEPSVRIYATEDHSPVSGEIYTKFTLSKTREVVRIRFCDEAGSYITQISWEGDSFSFGWRTSELASASKTITIPSSESVTIALRSNINSSCPQFSLWINGELMVDNMYSVTNISCVNFSMIQVYTLLYSSYSKAGTFSIDDVTMSLVCDVPTVEHMITENTFDSPETPNLITTNLVGGGSAEISNGVLNLIKTGSDTSQVGVNVYTGADNATSASGVVGLEFDIEREQSNTVQIRSMDSNGNLYYSMSWSYDGIAAYYSDDPAAQGTSKGVWTGSANRIHVNMMFDTANSTYWLWVNGQAAVEEKYSRSVGVGAICYTMFYLERINNVKIDNYKIYEAIPPKSLRLKFDLSGFGEDDMLNEIPQAGNIISHSVNLPSLLRYGTSVSWQSSHPDIINPSTGEVTRPVGVSENPLVTLTASFNNSGFTYIGEYKYYVLRDFPEGTNIAEQEANDIKHSYLTSENPNSIKTSLNLMDKGLYGSDIRWTSSNTSVITNSGRVIRPRFDEPDATVTMTAAIGEYSKKLSFTVLADEAPKDPMHTSDEEFFGVWNGTAFSVTPQLDYSISGLAAVQKCAKAGDYAGAKNALYEYFKVRSVPSPIGLGTRHPGWVDARADGLFEMSEEAAYWKGLMTVTSNTYEPVTVSLYKPSSISKSACKTFELIARYNECTSAYILGTGADDSAMVPTLELTVNGKVRSYKATNTATIRAGKYSREHTGNSKELTAKMFGGFLGDETYRILLAFDLSDISSSASVTDAKLTVYAKKSSPSADSKELWIIDNKGGAWSEDSVYWDSLNFAVHNYNGLMGGCDWKSARSSDIEFAYQMPRFMHARSTMSEYKYTGNEKYAYSLLSQVMDIITDTGSKTPYPRSLDAALRMQQLVPLMNTFAHSPYLTPDFCTAFMKYMYSQFEYFPTRKEATGNWREYEQLAVLYATSAYPELSNSASTKETCIWSWQNALSISFMPDGSYIEDTGGYHRSSFNMYRDFKKACMNSGTELPKEFDEALHKAAYYMALTNGPYGLSLQYGDEGGAQFGANRYSDISGWYSDDYLRFIDSFGTLGTKPSWTSYQFPDGRYTIMRSDWTKEAIYLHTNVRGGGGHGHADDNSIILMAGGRRLLVDAGKFTYNSYDPARLYGLSTQGHNTVVINDTSQRMSWTGNEYTVRGNINRWASNSAFDFLSQSTVSYPYHDHTRNILFKKDGLFVVSDRMVPQDISSENNYKQYWHMMPEAGISADADTKTLASGYSDGKNLIITSADDVSTNLEDGFYDMGDGTAVSNKAGVFEKNAAGVATLDTVMYVSDYADAKVSAEHLNTGMADSDVSALKITVCENNTSKTHYYMYNHTYSSASSISFGGYTTNARAALVSEDAEGNVTSMIMTDGSFIQKDGADIINTTGAAADICALFESKKIELSSGDSTLDAKDVTIAQLCDIEAVTYNGEYMDYTASNGTITVGDKEENGVCSDLYSVLDNLVINTTAEGTNGKTYLIGNLDFTVKSGESGSRITYTVSDTSLVSQSGTVTRASYDKPLTLTVTSSKNNISLSETLEFMIPGKYNKIGAESMPLISEQYSSDVTVTDTNTAGKTDSSQLTAFSNTNGKVSFTSAYAEKVEPGFTLTHSSNLTGRFVQELIFSSDSDALRIRFSDYSWNRKLDIYYLENGTLAAAGDTTVYHTSSFGGKKVRLSLDFSMDSNTADIYVDGELWLDDFALVSGGYRNIKLIMVSHHCATILGKWREGMGTTTFHSMNVYKAVSEASIMPVMIGECVYSNGGTPAAGINSVTVPVAATGSVGESDGGILVYAIYSQNKNAKKLVGISMQKLGLDKFYHREYTANINLDTDVQNPSQKVFVIADTSSVRPPKSGEIN